MTFKLEELIDKAQLFLRGIARFLENDEREAQDFLVEFMGNLANGRAETQYDDIVMKAKGMARDANVCNRPYAIADAVLENNPYTQEDIQHVLDNIERFCSYEPAIFKYMGVFISQMIMDATMPANGSLVLDTKNNKPPHNEELYTSDGYLNGMPEEICEYYRENALISMLASRLSEGQVTINGNVGSFFGCGNTGAHIIHNGESGWRPFYELKGGVITINGVAGHELALYGKGGRINVEGTIRSIGSLAREWGVVIIENGRVKPIDISNN